MSKGAPTGLHVPVNLISSYVTVFSIAYYGGSVVLLHLLRRD